MALRPSVHTLLVYALAGLMTSVAVAWALAAWAPHKATRVVWRAFENPANPGADRYIVSEYRGPGYTRVFTHAGGSGPISQPGTAKPWAPDFAGSYELRQVLAEDLPSWQWARTRVLRPMQPLDAQSGTDDARGWPMLALRCRARVHWDPVPAGPPSPRTGRHETVGGVLISPAPDTSEWMLRNHGATFRALPFIPMWGLAANTVFYACCWAALLAAIRWVRGDIRHSRGLCPRCGYELGAALASGCPECGWLKAKPANAT